MNKRDSLGLNDQVIGHKMRDKAYWRIIEV